MRDARTLSLKREALSDLTPYELVTVAGGQALTHVTCPATDACTTGPSLDRCPTVPVNVCITRAIGSPETLLCK